MFFLKYLYWNERDLMTIRKGQLQLSFDSWTMRYPPSKFCNSYWLKHFTLVRTFSLLVNRFCLLCFVFFFLWLFNPYDYIDNLHTAWKVSKYGVFSGQYFPVFRLNTEIYSVNLRIQSKYRKIRTIEISIFGHFLHSDNLFSFQIMCSI